MSSNDLTPITGELDDGVADVVSLLREHGINTFSSCAGGSGHGFDKPTVRVRPSHPLNMPADEVRIARVLSDAGYGGYYIKQMRPYQNDAWPWANWQHHFIEIEFWSSVV